MVNIVDREEFTFSDKNDLEIIIEDPHEDLRRSKGIEQHQFLAGSQIKGVIKLKTQEQLHQIKCITVSLILYKEVFYRYSDYGSLTQKSLGYGKVVSKESHSDPIAGDYVVND